MDTSSRQWLIACLARYIVRMPTQAQRRAMIERMEIRRGARFAAELRAAIIEAWPTRGARGPFPEGK